MSEQLLPLAAAAGAVLLAVCCLPVLGVARAVPDQDDAPTEDADFDDS